MSPTPLIEASEGEILAVVSEHYKPGMVWPGYSAYYGNAKRFWFERKDIAGLVYRECDHKGVSLQSLRKLAKKGLLVERVQRNPYGGRSHTSFTTPEVKAAIDAEDALTDAERAERTTASIAVRYDENRAQYGDRIGLWPVDVSIMGVISDGLSQALEAGLVVEASQVKGWGGKRYVPADRYDAWLEAYEDEKLREHRHQEHVDARVARLLEFAPKTDDRSRVVELSLTQVEALIKLLEER